MIFPSDSITPLVCHVFHLHKTEMEISSLPPEIFDRQRRRALQERATSRGGDSFLWSYVADELAERLDLVSRLFENVLIIGPMMHYADRITRQRPCSIISSGEACEERLPFESQRFDLVIAAGTLDSVNDLPGALVQIRKILKPDGLFLGHMFGAGSLMTLKSLMLAAEGNMAAPHIHPQIDLRSAADLLSRAGFALPVADADMMAVRYANWRTLVTDIRDSGIGNALSGPRHYLGKGILGLLDREWRRRADENGKIEEQFSHIFLSGWAPAPHQPRPARRGSGQISLSSVLPQPEKS
jgi:NADH dehydrogenase [ubiquinone] 1 alpha subcomplex assembly factor 5